MATRPFVLWTLYLFFLTIIVWCIKLTTRICFMKNSIKTLFVLGSIIWLGNISAVAQSVVQAGRAVEGAVERVSSQVIRRGSRTFKQGLRLGGRSYITPSVTIGNEILLPTGTSTIGGIAQQKYLNTLQRTQVLGNSISRQLARHISGIEEPDIFPGFFVSFPKKWQQFTHNTGVTIWSLSVILDAAFGRDSLGQGAFVASFEEVRRLSVLPVEKPVPFEHAMQDALNQAEIIKNGFFVIRVAGNELRPKDTLILDISSWEEKKPFRWISVNQSRDKAWKAVLAEDYGETIISPNVSGIDRRETQGIWLRSENLHKGYIQVSVDGSNWQTYFLANGPQGQTNLPGDEILSAWNKGYYILLPKQEGGAVGFSESVGAFVYPSVSDLELSLKKLN